tara:strand:+ start:1273 stop:1464 length:192 start_codon:yes stop_codon:yes gene_type:complete
MSKQKVLSYIKLLKYKEPPKINININTIEDIFKIKNQKKNIDINDINYSKNFWENVEKYKYKK